MTPHGTGGFHSLPRYYAPPPEAPQVIIIERDRPYQEPIKIAPPPRDWRKMPDPWGND